MRKIMVLGAILILFVLALFTAGCKKEGAAQTGPSGKIVQSVGKSGCEDSDGGVVVGKAGKVSGVADGKEYAFYDMCPVPDGDFLLEYYCENDISEKQNIRCPSGTRCLGGACRSR